MLADRYELEHEIGRGGMGTVWLGRDTVLGRAVAIKQIGMVPGGGAPDLARAEREARLAARVNHQNVVAVFDLVDQDGYRWLIMEYVDGTTLAGLIAERGTLDPEEVAWVIAQVAAALAAAHAHGIVHRDVKPSNILLTHDGIAKLSDFGVARAQADASLTQTGLVTGSPGYLSPEVASGRMATAASDVWSLGATAFHAVAGHPPYEVADNLLGTMYRIVNEEPPRLEGGGRVAELVESMMQRDPAARPAMAEIERSAAEFTATVLPGLAATSEPTAVLDLDATQAIPAVVADPAPTPTSAFRPLERPVDGPARETDHRRTAPPTLWIAAAVAAVAITVVALAAIAGSRNPDAEEPRAAATSGQSASPAADKGPTAGALEGFASDYLTAASNDPDEGFAMLTPAYQKESGGIKGYKGFWGRVSNLDIETVRGDAEALTVAYTYSYDFDGDRRTEDVTLRLQDSGDSFLISGTN